MRRVILALSTAALAVAVVAAIALGSTRASAGTGDKIVVVNSGQKVEIAFAAAPSLGAFSTGARRAIAMAIAISSMRRLRRMRPSC